MTATDINPYSPPEAEVRDSGPARLLSERPRQVVYVTALLTISLALSLPGLHWQSRRGAESWALEIWTLGFVLAVSILFIVTIWRGRNWARLLYTILTILSIVSSPFLDTNESVVNPPSFTETALDVVTWLLGVPIFYLLFTKPGSLWFKYAQERRVLEE